MLHVYKGNPTAGLQDGIQVSEGDGSSPIVAGAIDSTNAAKLYSDPIKLALRCDAGYQAGAGTIVQAAVDRWELAEDNNGVPGVWVHGINNDNPEDLPTLIIQNPITNANVIFWARTVAALNAQPVTETDPAIMLYNPSVTGV